MANDNLSSAKAAKNDEFYTQYEDIEKEMNAYLEFNKDVFKGKTVLLPCDDPDWSNFTRYFAQNFKRLGLKKVISTSYAPNSKEEGLEYEPAPLEKKSPAYDAIKTRANGKIFTLTKDITGDGIVNFDDFEWKYLEGDGDFRSDEIKALRDEADFVITNPPFSLFREFITWLNEGKKHYSIIGNSNAITYKEIFPLIKDNKMWLGATRTGVGSMWFEVPDNSPDKTGQKIENGKKYQTIGNSAWFTNIDHGVRHEPLTLMTKADNLKFNKSVKENGYQKYDNYDAIEVSRVDSIPSDETGVMGVPITFLGKYNPDQFEILGSRRWSKDKILSDIYYGTKTADTDFKTLIGGRETYDRIFIKHKKGKKK